MKCPICNVDLVMSERQGFEVDYCPQCGGVWLDHREVDKIIERSQTMTAEAYPGTRENIKDSRHYEDHGGYDCKGHKRKSFFSEWSKTNYAQSHLARSHMEIVNIMKAAEL